MNEQITVIAEFRVRAESVDRFKAAASPVVRLTRREAGCLNYDLHHSLEDETIFLMHENWTNAAALEQHLTAAHVREFLIAAAELLSQPVAIRRFARLDD